MTRRPIAALTLCALSGVAAAGPNFQLNWTAVDMNAAGAFTNGDNELDAFSPLAQTWQLALQFNGGLNFFGVDMSIYLEGGANEVFNHSLENPNQTEPNAALIPGSPDLQFDSYIALGNAQAGQIAVTQPISWGTATNPYATGTWLVSNGGLEGPPLRLVQVTVSSGSLSLGGLDSFLTIQWSEPGQQMQQVTLAVPQIPAPGGAALAGVALSAAAMRRRG